MGNAAKSIIFFEKNVILFVTIQNKFVFLYRQTTRENNNKKHITMNKHERMIEMHIKRGVNILDALPDGWRFDKLATTAPVGYIWANNGVSLFDKTYESALIRINL